MADLNTHMIAFVAVAVMTIAVLTLGTLAAAELLPTRKRDRRDDRAHPSSASDPDHTPRRHHPA